MTGPNAELIAAARDRAQTDSPTHTLIRDLAAALSESDAEVGRLRAENAQLYSWHRFVVGQREDLQARIDAALAIRNDFTKSIFQQQRQWNAVRDALTPKGSR